MKNNYIIAAVLGSAGALTLFGFIANQVPAPSNIQPWEHRFRGYSFTVADRQIELEGVCKFSEDGMVCWKADGSPNRGLAERLNGQLQYMTFPMTYHKKYRMLYFKCKFPASLRPDFDTPSDGYMIKSIEYDSGWHGSAQNLVLGEVVGEGLKTLFGAASGQFEFKENEAIFHYRFNAVPGEPTVVKLEPGRFEVDGNTFEIVSIANHPERTTPLTQYEIVNQQVLAKPPKTDIVIRSVRIKNPHSLFTASLADKAGEAINMIDENDDPVSDEQYQAMIVKANSRPNEPFRNPPVRDAGKFAYRPYLTKSKNSTIVANFNVEKSKCKRLLILPYTGQEYVFEHIKLDPK